MCTDEEEVGEYWHNIDAACDLDIRVIDDVEASAAEVAENNNFLTYGEQKPQRTITELMLL